MCVFAGEKTSLLNKLFGRSKSSKRSSSAGHQPEVSTDTTDPSRPLKEYATFSAQFPPPEWQWYERQYGVADPHQVAALQPDPRKVHTWHYNQGAPRFFQDAETQSVLDGEDSEELDNIYECPIHRASTLPVGMSAPGFHQAGGPVMQYTEDPSGLYEAGRHSSHNSQESRNSQQETSFELDDSKHRVHNHRPSRHHQSRTHRQESPNVARQRSLDNQSPTQHSNPGNNNGDVRPKAAPVQDLSGNSYWDKPEHQPIAEEASAAEGRSQDYGTSKQVLNNAHVPVRLERPTHVSRVFKKYREMKCGSFLSNDINVEYQGRLDKRASQFAKSRDSGVNCVGLSLTETNNMDGGPQTKLVNSDGARPSSQALQQVNNLSGGEATKLSNLSPQVQAQNSPTHSSPRVASPAHNSPAVASPAHNSLVHEVLVHHSPENVHEDSGFNSPRTNDLPNSTKTSPFGRSYSCETPQGYKQARTNHNLVQGGPLSKSASLGDGSTSRHDSDPSYESLPMVDSPRQPQSFNARDNQNHLGHHSSGLPDKSAGMWSDSSKQTVLEADQGAEQASLWPVNPNRASTPLSVPPHPRNMPQSVQRKEGENAGKQVAGRSEVMDPHRTKHSHHKTHGASRSDGRTKGRTHHHKSARDSFCRDVKSKPPVPADTQHVNGHNYDISSKITGIGAVRAQDANIVRDVHNVERHRPSDFEVVGMI